jgi:hypothetical protein
MVLASQRSREHRKPWNDIRRTPHEFSNLDNEWFVICQRSEAIQKWGSKRSELLRRYHSSQ